MKEYEYKTYKKCRRFYKDNIKTKIACSGISEDLFYALKELYNNTNFQEFSDGATKRNNELLFGENDITFLNYSNKKFKSSNLNPCINREKVNLLVKVSKIMIKENVHKNCIDLKLIVHISKRSKISVRYNILINITNYNHIERFMKIYDMSKQLEL